VSVPAHRASFAGAARLARVPAGSAPVTGLALDPGDGVPAVWRVPAMRAAAGIAFLGAIVALRAAMVAGGVDGVLAGAVFGGLLLVLAVASGWPRAAAAARAGWRRVATHGRVPAIPRSAPAGYVPLATENLARVGSTAWSLAAPGIAVGAALVALSWVARLDGPALPLGLGGVPFVPWAMVTMLVAAAEESVLRGSLYGSVASAGGVPAAIVVTSLLFALLHVPTYGWPVAPLDFGVGLVLGGLRALTGRTAAPAVAHAVADLAAWFM